MLNGHELEKLIRENGLITDYIDLKTQLTPNGFDMTAGAIFGFDSQGAVDFSNKERVIPQAAELAPKKQKPSDKFGWWELKKGAYKIRTNETVTVPNDLIAVAFTRTSLLRAGAFTVNGVWDAGFRGRSEFMLVVENPEGIRLKQNARVIQLIFQRINEAREGYNGIYKEK